MCALHEHAAPVEGIGLALRKIKFAQPVQGPRYGGLGDIQLDGKPPDCLGGFVQVTGEQYAQLPGREVGLVIPNQANRGLPQDLQVGVL